ncbi:D-tyrosyl-tRNA deacylase [Thelephora ganbajun]|uniref:D-tyrosyl-tRNA deacylase n=1 Tax=Thelephora ganbajun TaxID=370292 RepID=A0ACB6Z5U0_THEGA|nr:D-tyrosyl-tRNA deacylase [Thelephora ganbajun]
MRAVLQRVASASVTVDGAVVSEISRGLMVLVGIGTDDTVADIELLTNKILQIRVFDDPATGSMWKQSVKDINGDVLCVSQFTLFANTHKGNKPDFHRAMGSEKSKEMYALFLERMGKLYKPEKIKDGKFGAMMNVSLTNEGPVTLTLDSRKFEYVEQSQPTSRKGSTKPSRTATPTPGPTTTTGAPEV